METGAQRPLNDLPKSQIYGIDNILNRSLQRIQYKSENPEQFRQLQDYLGLPGK